MTDSNKSVSPLRRRMLDDMTMRKLQAKTRAAYIRAVKNFTHFFGRSISWRCHRPDQRTCQHWRSRIFSATTARRAPRHHRRVAYLALGLNSSSTHSLHRARCWPVPGWRTLGPPVSPAFPYRYACSHDCSDD